MIEIKHFENKEDQIKWLVENKSLISSQRKSEQKRADAFSHISFAVDDRGTAIKDEAISQNATMLKVRSIINTTNLFDSHADVHIDGIWKKNLQESKDHFLCQEHELSFKGIIADEVKAYTKTMTWKELGFDLPGSTQALVFDSIVYKDRNPYMFDQYAKGYVKNHSVRMQYMKEYFCVNSDSPAYTQEKENWDKYIQPVVNKDAAEARGYFWAVTEAKIIEGSAVVKGSNFITPTDYVLEYQNTEAGKTTSSSRVTTQKRKQLLNELLKKVK